MSPEPSRNDMALTNSEGATTRCSMDAVRDVVRKEDLVDPTTKSSPDRQDLPPLEKWRKWSVFACSCLLQFLLQLDMASVAVTLPVRDNAPWWIR